MLLNRISIITVCKNAEKSIEKTIISIVSQTYENIEYIIVDGASTDRTIEIIKQYSEKYYNIKWISEPDSGIYQAMNKGIKLATGDIIAFLNAGDYYLDENVVSDVCNRIVNDSEYLIYSANLYGLSHDRTKFLNFNVSKARIDSYFFFTNTLPHISTFYRKEVFERCGIFDESFKISGDREHFIRCFMKYKISIKIMGVYTSFFDLSGVSSQDQNRIQMKIEGKKIVENYFSYKLRFFIKLKIIIRKLL